MIIDNIVVNCHDSVGIMQVLVTSLHRGSITCGLLQNALLLVGLLVATRASAIRLMIVNESILMIFIATALTSLAAGLRFFQLLII